ncbi:MAG: CidA/LrgA family protein [Sphaerochaeta sp.]|uniref:CidA/LrgA family protein n=1 Tax=Sphaerochaeta sp. TaxID=1972642 RepID=UPI002FCBBCC5
MKYLNQLALIFGICLVGDVISRYLPFTLPGSVISMLLILLLLSTSLLTERQLGESADFLLRNMTFFFIPPGVGILRYALLIQSIWWQLILVNLISLVVCFGVSSWTVVLVQRLQKALLGRSHG